MASKKKPSDGESPRHLSQMSFADALAQFAVGDMGMGAPTGTPFMSADMQRPARPKRRRNDDEPIETTGYVVEDDDDVAMSVLHEDLTVDKLRKERDAKDEDTDYDDRFDSLIEGTFASDEDSAFRNALVSMGRKYAIEGIRSEDKAASEVSRSFARQENAIAQLIEEYQKSTVDVQSDLDLLRGTRSRNYKALADLVSAKASMLSGRLAAIKELDSIAAKKHELQIKIDNARKETGDGTSAEAQRVIQQLFSVGRGNYVAIDSPGDSGATEEEYSGAVGDSSPGGADYTDGTMDTEIADKMDSSDDSSDGDKFIQYEAEGVEWVLDIGEDGEDRQIYAINSSGEVVPDYPLPSDPNSLTFDINDRMGTATDQLQRTYRIRKAGVDYLDAEKPAKPDQWG